MKHSRKILFAIVLIIGIVGCKAKKNIMVTQLDAERAATIFPGATLASLNDGKMHYENNCGKCHGLKDPKSEDEAGWREVVPPMADKAEIDDKTENLILQYVVTMSKAASN